MTRHPPDAWVTLQRREATPFARYLIRDNDAKYGRVYAQVAVATGIAALRTAYRTPKQHATCERFLVSIWRACLDHILVLGEAHLRRVLRAYVAYCNGARSHQGWQHRLPAGTAGPERRSTLGGKVHAVLVLGGLHHTNQRAA